MKCFVCHKEYQGQACPRCEFPNVQVPGASREKAMQDLAPAIHSYRKTFLESIRLDTVICYWKDDNGVIALDHEDVIPLGTGTELYGGEKWHPQKLARVKELTRIPVRLRIGVRDTYREVQVEVENLSQPQLQQLGVEMDEDFNIRLKLRNDAAAMTISTSVPW